MPRASSRSKLMRRPRRYASVRRWMSRRIMCCLFGQECFLCARCLFLPSVMNGNLGLLICQNILHLIHESNQSSACKCLLAMTYSFSLRQGGKPYFLLRLQVTKVQEISCYCYAKLPN